MSRILGDTEEERSVVPISCMLNPIETGFFLSALIPIIGSFVSLCPGFTNTGNILIYFSDFSEGPEMQQMQP